MVLVSALLGGMTGFLSFLAALIFAGAPLATAFAIYFFIALASMVALNLLALVAAQNQNFPTAADQYS